MSILAAQKPFAHTFDPRVVASKALHLKQCAYRCRMPGSSVKDKLSGAVPADEMIGGLIVAQFLGDNFNQACCSSASKLLPAAKSAMYNRNCRP